MSRDGGGGTGVAALEATIFVCAMCDAWGKLVIELWYAG